jgi:hypothetical protein
LLALILGYSQTWAFDGETRDVNWAGAKPYIYAFTAELYGGIVIVSGRVEDKDEDPNGWDVTIWGAENGVAYVGPNGYFTAYFSQGAPYGEVYASTSDSDGHVSNIAVTEIVE